ncbi:MAG: NAD(+)/NADH kinase [Coriobacteriia bacterium]|nr:NAD(+)/NADH kinase [Coriobacteriia bacterium]
MRIAFCVHPKLAHATEQRIACVKWLAARGVEAVEVDSNQLLIDSPEFSQITEEAKDISLVCVLGGDGTILRGTRLAYALEVPLLGVNFGNLGFLSGATSGALFPALEAFLAGELHEDSRGMLSVDATFSDGSVVHYTALNEILIGRSAIGKVIVVNISVNGNPLPAPRGDGVIVATATGSTAYALSAGGPLLTPDHQGLCIVPVSCLGFHAAALVSAPSDVIHLSAQPHADQYPLLCIDGQPLETNLGENHVCSVVVTKAERPMVLLRYNTPDFYARIAHSLAGGSHAH